MEYGAQKPSCYSLNDFVAQQLTRCFCMRQCRHRDMHLASMSSVLRAVLSYCQLIQSVISRLLLFYPLHPPGN